MKKFLVVNSDNLKKLEKEILKKRRKRRNKKENK